MTNMKTRSKTRALALLLMLAMVLALLPTMALAANPTESAVGLNFQFGDPSYTETSPEKDMVFSGTEPTFTIDYSGPLNNNTISDQTSFYPYILSFYVTGGVDTIAAISGTGLTYELYNADSTDYAPIANVANIPSGCDTLGITITLDQVSASGRKLEITTNAASNNLLTLNFNQPYVYTVSTSATTPTALNGYLPIGQYASGAMWGSPYSDGTASTGSTPKVVGGFSSTGVSLGAAGGYVEYNFALNNDTARPYGIDFLVYGNAFVNNPEAASVKVYGTTSNGVTGWYELAGSLYYNDMTQRNVDVTYKKVTAAAADADPDDVFTSAGIWYKYARNGVTITDWTKFNTNTSVAWWPESTEGYLGTNGVWGNVADVVISTDLTEITYKNVTLVKDTDTTSDYAFGYADITPNGSSYGTVTSNPYVYSTTGGNGYDLDWAVDNDGNPVSLSSISKVRVYTSAALNTSNPLYFTTPSIFGETSAEVCGVYAASGTATSSTVTPMALVKKNGNTITRATSDVVSNTQCHQTVSVATSDSISISSAASYVYVNGELKTATSASPYTFSPNLASGETMTVQILTQTSDRAAYIRVIDFVGA